MGNAANTICLMLSYCTFGSLPFPFLIVFWTVKSRYSTIMNFCNSTENTLSSLIVRGAPVCGYPAGNTWETPVDLQTMHIHNMIKALAANSDSLWELDIKSNESSICICQCLNTFQSWEDWEYDVNIPWKGVLLVLWQPQDPEPSNSFMRELKKDDHKAPSGLLIHEGRKGKCFVSLSP